MKWFVVFLFYTLHGDIYVFTEPHFDNREQCMASLFDIEQRKKYVAKLVLEYGKLMPIQSVNCIDEDTYKSILQETETPDIKV